MTIPWEQLQLPGFRKAQNHEMRRRAPPGNAVVIVHFPVLARPYAPETLVAWQVGDAAEQLELYFTVGAGAIMHTYAVRRTDAREQLGLGTQDLQDSHTYDQRAAMTPAMVDSRIIRISIPMDVHGNAKVSICTCLYLYIRTFRPQRQLWWLSA